MIFRFWPIAAFTEGCFEPKGGSEPFQVDRRLCNLLTRQNQLAKVAHTNACKLSLNVLLQIDARKYLGKEQV